MAFNDFHDGGRYHIETIPLICGANQRTGLYMITASVMKESLNAIFHLAVKIKLVLNNNNFLYKVFGVINSSNKMLG